MKLYLDTCAISYYCSLSLDLANILLSENFDIVITKGVIKELEDIPETEPVKKCVNNILLTGNYTEKSFFGFADANNKTPRYISGFNEGTLADHEQGNFLDQTGSKLGKELKSGLRRHETDRDLLAHGLKNIVVTAENSVGKSLQNIAEVEGTIVINVRKFSSPADLITHIKSLFSAT